MQLISLLAPRGLNYRPVCHFSLIINQIVHVWDLYLHAVAGWHLPMKLSNFDTVIIIFSVKFSNFVGSIA